MWGEWIAGALAEKPAEDLLAVSFGGGEGFFSVGGQPNRSWKDLDRSTPIVGGRAFFKKPWGAWAAEEFLVPEFFVHRVGDREEIISSGISIQKRAASQSVAYAPACWENPNSDRSNWDGLCTKIDAGIASKLWEKIVPARSARFRFGQEKPNLSALWTRLLEFTPYQSHRFLWKKGSEIFIGASPELLFSFDGARINSMAVAGTATSEAGLYNEKTKREHEIVVRDISERLSKVASGVDVGCLDTINYGTLVHLATRISADAPTENSHKIIANTIDTLHPTSAVGGLPAAVANDFLTENEWLERGYYASPIGFSFRNRAKFLVAIRSARVAGNYGEIYAGAGYVKGSSAESEWQETDAKMRTMARVFGLESRP